MYLTDPTFPPDSTSKTLINITTTNNSFSSNNPIQYQQHHHNTIIPPHQTIPSISPNSQKPPKQTNPSSFQWNKLPLPLLS